MFNSILIGLCILQVSCLLTVESYLFNRAANVEQQPPQGTPPALPSACSEEDAQKFQQAGPPSGNPSSNPADVSQACHEALMAQHQGQAPPSNSKLVSKRSVGNKPHHSPHHQSKREAGNQPPQGPPPALPSACSEEDAQKLQQAGPPSYLGQNPGGVSQACHKALMAQHEGKAPPSGQGSVSKRSVGNQQPHRSPPHHSVSKRAAGNQLPQGPPPALPSACSEEDAQKLQQAGPPSYPGQNPGGVSQACHEALMAQHEGQAPPSNSNSVSKRSAIRM